MPTIQQLVRLNRTKIIYATKSPALKHVHKDVVFALVFIQQHLKSQIQQFVKLLE